MAWFSITENEIADVRADKKTAKRVEKYMISKKAIYFEGKYLPIAQIQSVSIHDSTYNPYCCCGRGIPVKKLKIEYGADKPLILMLEKETNAAKMADLIEDARNEERILKMCTEEYSFYGWKSADITDEMGLTPRDYYDLLANLWTKETCAPRLQKDWSEDNKTLGQCSITAFLMQDIYGGKVYGIPRSGGTFHCFNDVNGCVFDLTSEQFKGEKLDYTNCPEQFREVHFAKEEKRQRYELLKAKVEAVANQGKKK